jgi:uncharacterized membrane protein HdeD (DUF308 family)
MESGLSGEAQAREAIRDVSNLWWGWLVAGIFWVVVGLVILQFDQASITTVGVLIGLMFFFTAIQIFLVGSLAGGGLQLLHWIFGLLLLVAAVLAFISPENTFAAIADILGFLFLLVGAFWVIQAFATREINDLWWLGLIAGILMIILAFWTAGQFFIEKQYVLLVFAGIWALLQGFTDITKAFVIRKVGQIV